MPRILPLAACATLVGWSLSASAQIVLLSSFDPASTGSLCGAGQDPDTANVWVYPCSGGEVFGFALAGDPIGSVPRPGESANDVDVEFAPVSFALGGTTLSTGTLLFINGESGPAEIYAVDKATGSVLDTLATDFGVSHVVGGAFHPIRNTFFLVQDNVPGPADENRIAEVDPVSGDTLQTFQIGDAFNVSYGDLDVSDVTGNLFVVSSAESAVAEFTPDGRFVQEHALPAGVSGLSGIALDCATQEAWVSSRTGVVARLGQVPCGSPTSAEGDAPAPLRLSAAFPNPFRDRVSFSLDVERPHHVRVAAYDLLGREVEQVYDGEVGLGRQTFTLGRDWPVGIYLLRVVGEGLSATQRVVRTE